MASGGRSSSRRPGPSGSRASSPSRPASRSSRRRIRGRSPDSFDDELPTDEGWAKLNRHYWRRDYPGLRRASSSRRSPPSRIRRRRSTTPSSGRSTARSTRCSPTWTSPLDLDLEASRRPAAPVACPMLIVHGTEDTLPADRARPTALAELTGAPLVVVEGADHMIPGRHPVLANLLIRDFIRSIGRRGVTRRPSTRATAPATRTWTRALARKRRALYISSPIGLGHAQRDVAIADELRMLQPDLEIDWLAQTPVTSVLETRGERIHPLSAELASESAHITAESSEHDLNAFQAIRRMDEILVANFMVFYDAVEGGEYDLVIGDEAWDIDHFLHENPELKSHRLRLDDRLRRLAADALGRRARGVPDGRLQRRDDRARRALPAPARPGDLRRRSRRHRARRLRSGAAVDPRLDRAPFRVQRLRHRLRSGAAHRASRGAAPRARLPARRTGRDRHGRRLRVSARRCCAGSSPAIRTPRVASTACG